MNNAVEPSLDQLHLIEIGRVPRVETELLKNVLARRPEQRSSLADVYSYKHRLHALRCENFALRLEIHDLETQLKLMRQTRGWKLLEKFRWWRRTVSGWLQPFRGNNSETRP